MIPGADGIPHHAIRRNLQKGPKIEDLSNNPAKMRLITDVPQIPDTGQTEPNDDNDLHFLRAERQGVGVMNSFVVRI